MAQTLLDLPTPFTWATGANRTITPATAGILPATGWDFSQEPPPRLMNYIHNLQGEWGESSALKAIANTNTAVKDWAGGGAFDAIGIARNPATGIWLLLQSGVTTSYISFNGYGWVASAGALGSAPYTGAVIVTDSNSFVVGTVGTLYWAADDAITSWTSVGTGASLIANVGTSDYFLTANLVADSAGVKIWATGIAGGEVSPSVTSWGATALKGLAGETVDSWALVDANGDCHVSADGGDNWTQAAEGPVDAIAGFDPNTLDFHDGTLVAGGDDTTNARIAYSHDGGATWLPSAMLGARRLGNTIYSVKALGGSRWVAVGDNVGTDFHGRTDYFCSVDDGVTWYAGCPRTLTDTTDELYHVCCTGGRVAAVGKAGSLLMTDLVAPEEGDIYTW